MTLPAQFAFTPRGMSTDGSGTPAAQVVLTLSGTAQYIPFPTSGVGFTNFLQTIRLVMDGGTGVAWCYGNNTTTLTIDNGVPMLANTIETFGVPPGCLGISAVGATAAGKLRISFGEGT